MSSQLAEPVCLACEAFGRCGGCDLLDLGYGEQLALKQREVESLFRDAIPNCEIAPIAGMDEPAHYRNKVIAPFVAKRPSRARSNGERANGRSRNGKPADRSFGQRRQGIATGMYAKGTHDVIEVPGGCVLENPLAHKAINAIKAIMLKHGVEPYNEDRGTGFMRHAVIRVGHNSGEALVTLVTNSDEFPHSKSFCKELIRKVPEVTSVVQNVNLRQTNVVLGERERTLYGPGFILDELCGARFRLSSRSFYQVNSVQTEVLYRQAMRLAKLDEGHSKVVDAYCGTGTIGVIAARFGADEVVGVDSVDSAIRDARQNAHHNGLRNAEYVCADAADFMASGAAGNVDVVFMDPPRAGSSERFLNAVAKAAPKRVVYISCNPQTQARDVSFLSRCGYAVEAMQPVDMFPHTRHVENIVALVQA